MENDLKEIYSIATTWWKWFKEHMQHEPKDENFWKDFYTSSISLYQEQNGKPTHDFADATARAYLGEVERLTLKYKEGPDEY